MVNLFHCFFKHILFRTSFPYMASLCAKQQKAQHWGGGGGRIATTSNSSVVGALLCRLDCSLALFLVCSRSGSSAASLCLYFVQLSALVEGFFVVAILLLGSGDILIKCHQPEI